MSKPSLSTHFIVYVANADSADISVLALDRASGAVTPMQRVDAGGTVKPLALSPDRRFLHAALRTDPAGVLSLAIEPTTGLLTVLGRASLPYGMSWLSSDHTGRFLFSAAYADSAVAVNPIDADGIAQASSQVLPMPRHAHSIQVDPSNRFAFVASLGGGVISQLRFDVASGVLTPNEPPTMVPHQAVVKTLDASRTAVENAMAGETPGADAPSNREARQLDDTRVSPRHFVFHPHRPMLYLLNEFGAVDTLAFDAERGTLQPLQSQSAMPPDADGEAWCADIHITPDGRFVVTSERRSSTLTSWRVDAASGFLERIADVPTEAQPRGFALTPDGRFAVVVGELSHALSVHAIDAGSGRLHKVAGCAVGRGPNWVQIADLMMR